MDKTLKACVDIDKAPIKLNLMPTVVNELLSLYFGVKNDPVGFLVLVYMAFFDA